MERLDLIGEKDLPAILAAAQCWARLQAGARICRQEGVLGANPDRQRHPAVGVCAEESRNLIRFLSEFGLTPSSEVRLGLRQARHDPDNPFAGTVK
jgi:P27 family predicted phage terminase small subunit